jgi:Domain of unknown function (DUF1707)
LSQVPDVLVSDAERERVADDLRGHYQAGRLTLEEFQQRLDEAHAARTATQLKSALRQLPSARVPTVNPRDTRWRSLALQYALVNVVATLVWLFGGQHGDFWPKWVLLATLIMFTRRTFGRRRRLPPEGFLYSVRGSRSDPAGWRRGCWRRLFLGLWARASRMAAARVRPPGVTVSAVRIRPPVIPWKGASKP